MTRLILFLSCFVLLAGCATPDTYREPKGDRRNLATLKSSSNYWSGLVVWSQYHVEAIDGGPISVLRHGTLHNLSLQPGNHKILVFAKFDNSWLNTCPCEGRIVLTADFEPDRKYRINGKVVDNQINAWIEEAETRKRVSEVSSGVYSRSPVTIVEEDDEDESLSSLIIGGLIKKALD